MYKSGRAKLKLNATHGVPKADLARGRIGEMPFGASGRHFSETEVEKLFEKGDCLAGAIIFSGRSDKFEYIMMKGTLDKPLIDQCPWINSKCKNLGNLRYESVTLQYEETSNPYVCFVFCRVLFGCSQLQIMATTGYLNSQLKGDSFIQKVACYETLSKKNRDFLHPGFKYMTRSGTDKQYQWFPMTLGDKTTISESEAVCNGRDDSMIDLLMMLSSPPRKLTVTVEESELNGDTVQLVPDEGLMATLDKNAEVNDLVPEVESSEGPKNASESENVESGDKLQDVAVPQNEATVNDDMEGYAIIQADIEVPDEVLLEPPGQDGTKEKQSNQGDAQRVDDQQQAGAESGDDDDDEEEIDDVEPDEPDDGKKKVARPAVQGVLKNNNVDKEDELDFFLDENEPKLRGLARLPTLIRMNKTLTGRLNESLTKEPLDKNDMRPLSLRLLHCKLPLKECDIPSMEKKRFMFQKLVHEIRELEIAYNTEANIDQELPPLEESKLLTKREATSERKHILGLMEARDKWCKQHSEKSMALMEKRRKAKRSLDMRKVDKKRVEIAELQRLSNVEEQEANRTMNEAAQAEAERLTKAKSLGHSENGLNVTGKIQPLSSVFGRRTVLRPAVQLEASFQAENNNVSRQSSIIGAPLASSSMCVDDNNKFQTNSILDANVMKLKPVSGYVKADAVQLLQTLTSTQASLTKKIQTAMDDTKSQYKTLTDKLKCHENAIKQLVDNFALMKTAFLEYDMTKNLNLNEAQSKLTAYLPFDELGPKVDFLLTNPATSKTIAKHIMTAMAKKGINNPNAGDVVTWSMNKLFRVDVRAHLSTGKPPNKTKSRPTPRGWHKLETPQSYKDFMEKYMLPLCDRSKKFDKNIKWIPKLKENFKNASHSYFNHYCGKQANQGLWVEKRYHLRLELIERHTVGEQALEAAKRVITLQEELNNYAEDSLGKDKTGQDLYLYEQSQIEQKTLDNPSKPRLPDMATLVNMASKLQELIDATVVITKETKEAMKDLSTQFESSPADSNNGKESPPGEKRPALPIVDSSDEFASDGECHTNSLFNFDKTFEVTRNEESSPPSIAATPQPRAQTQAGTSASKKDKKRKLSSFMQIPSSVQAVKKKKKMNAKSSG